MLLKSVRIVYFSPTGTTRQVLEAIATGTGLPLGEPVNLTTPWGNTESLPSFRQDELIILGGPVYSGRLPRIAAQRLQRLKAPSTPAVLVAVYGNRAFEDALLEMQDIAAASGFVPVAGAAFIGEHSFSSPANPIAAGRPDQADLALAGEFGQQVRSKLEGTLALTDLSPLVLPGNHPYKESSPEMQEYAAQAVTPSVIVDKCTACGTCVNVCPVGVAAFRPGPTAVGRCLRCHSCIKNCPTGARFFPLATRTTELIEQSTKWLVKNFSRRREPELFI